LSRAAEPAPRKPPRAAAFRLQDHLFYYFTQILARRTRALNVELRPFGLDYQRWRVLAALNEEATMSMGRLAELTSVDRTTLTRTLGLMEAEKLLSRAPNARDRRAIDISLTARGHRIFERILPKVLAQTERAVDGLTTDEVLSMRRLLTRMVDNLKP
jgi:DNA-binding MarR family transcriptional regulator